MTKSCFFEINKYLHISKLDTVEITLYNNKYKIELIKQFIVIINENLINQQQLKNIYNY